MGNGRRFAGGVRGGAGDDFGMGPAVGSTMVGRGGEAIGVNDDKPALSPELASDELLSEDLSRVSGGGGKDVLGEGGGSTNDVGRIDFAKFKGLGGCFGTSKAGAVMGMTSVSYAGSQLVGGGIEKMEERRDTRVLRPLPLLPPTACLRGDFFGDFLS